MKYLVYKIKFEQSLTDSQHSVVVGLFQDFKNSRLTEFLRMKENLETGGWRMRAVKFLDRTLGDYITQLRTREQRAAMLAMVEKSIIMIDRMFSFRGDEDRQHYEFWIGLDYKLIKQAKILFYKDNLSSDFTKAIESRVLLKPEITTYEEETSEVKE